MSDHHTRTSYSLELVDEYLTARMSGDMVGMAVAGTAIYAWLRDSGAGAEITTRLVTLVMAVARRCAEVKPLDGWHQTMRLAAPIDQQAPSGRLAIRLVLAYAAKDEDAAYELLLPLMRSCTVESLVDELMLTFCCLATLHEMSTAGSLS